MTQQEDAVRPADVCVALLAALDAADGRSRARKRDQTPDGIGLALRRTLLEKAVSADPEANAFEQWLNDQIDMSKHPGATRAIALAVLEDWRLAQLMPSFRCWLALGAPSEDVQTRVAL